MRLAVLVCVLVGLVGQGATRAVEPPDKPEQRAQQSNALWIAMGSMW